MQDFLEARVPNEAVAAAIGTELCGVGFGMPAYTHMSCVADQLGSIFVKMQGEYVFRGLLTIHKGPIIQCRVF